MRAELRGCPFCGDGRSQVAVYQDEFGCWRVSCGACGSSSGTRPASDPDGRAKVIAGWNARKDERSIGWMLSQAGSYFMVGIEPDGRIRIDGGHKEDWSSTNRERGELIDKSISGELNPSERRRLDTLQAYADYYLESVAPRPTNVLDELESRLFWGGRTKGDKG